MSLPMRRKNRQLEEAEAWEILRNGEYGTLSTVGGNGSPYGIPLSYAVIDRWVYFHCAKTGRKLENLRHEPRICFTVVGKTQPVFDGDFSTYYESAVVFGEAAHVEEDAEKLRALEVLCEKYLPDAMEHFDDAVRRSLSATDIWKLRVDEISGKAKRHRQTT